MPETRDLARRYFLRSMGTIALGGLGGGLVFRAFGGPGAGAIDGVLGDPLPTGTPILVLVDLNGGNDDLSTLVPIENAWYYDTTYGHGALAIPAASTRLPTGLAGFGLHPSLTWLAERWNTNRDVAFVLGVGQSESREFSHFVAEANWRSCVVGRPEPTGFLGRYNDRVHPGSSVAAISLSGLHPALVGSDVHVLGVPCVEEFGVNASWQWRDDGVYWGAYDQMADPNLTGNLGAAAHMIRQTLDAQATIRPAADPSLGAGLQWGSLAWQMAQAAMLINAGVPCQTYAGILGAFDTHDNQLEVQAAKLAEVDAALDLFFTAVSEERRADVCVLLHSEFGRQVTANGSAGTDHGQAGMDILVGAPVAGAVYGEAPTLDPGGPTRPNRIWDARIPTTDFRSVFATVMSWLGTDSGIAAEVLGRDFEEFPVFTGGPPQPHPIRLRNPYVPRRRPTK